MGIHEITINFAGATLLIDDWRHGEFPPRDHGLPRTTATRGSNGLGCGGAGGLEELAGARASSNWQLALESVALARFVRAYAC